MAQIVVYFDDETAKRVDEAVLTTKSSRSAWVREAVTERLERESQRLPEWWWRNLGTWEDARTAEAILEDIDAALVEGEEAEF